MGVPGHRLERMMNPKTVAIIGDKGPTYMWTNSCIPFQEKGGNLWSVQIDPKEIEGIEKLGVKNVTSLADIPTPIDFAVVAVPRQVSPRILKDLIDHKVGGATFFTSGFAETGEEPGISLQKQITEMARESGFNLVGPNCMGLYLPKAGVRFGPEAPVADDGRVGFLSQSGTHGGGFSMLMGMYGLHLSRCVSFGNAVVLDVGDYLDYLADDDETAVIGMYVEGVRNGRQFFETLRRAAAKKPVVVWKGGQTDAGARATMSHTGSLATQQAIWDAMMRQCGAITANNIDDTVDAMQALLLAKPLKGPRLALLAQTGGQSVSITDSFAKAGFQVPPLSDHTYKALGEFFNIVGGSYRNPLDISGTIQGKVDTLVRILEILDADPGVDGMVLEISAGFGARQWKKKPAALHDTLDALVAHRAKSAKSFITIMHPAHEEEYAGSIKPEYAKRRLPVFPSFDRGAAALARAYHYSQEHPGAPSVML